MKFHNNRKSIETIVSDFNAGKISIIPGFQRRTVWTLKDRKKLLRNILRGRPIPAIFLYKQQDGPKQVNNILDGKQRLESLILFIADSRPDDLKINKPKDYFRGNQRVIDEEMNFDVQIENNHSEPVSFKGLSDSQMALFRDFEIATIEIDMDSEEHPVPLNELIDLFIDINSSGKLVTRFDMVKAIKSTPLFKQVLSMIGKRRTHATKAAYYLLASTDQSAVLQKLQYVSSVDGSGAKVDRMWERMTELALFAVTKKHRSPAAVLNGFITAREDGVHSADHKKMPPEALERINLAFSTIASAYRRFPVLRESALATSQPYFYTMATTLMTTSLIDDAEAPEMGHRLKRFAELLADPTLDASLTKDVEAFIELTKQKTTHPDRRKKRQVLFEKIIGSV